MHNFHQYWTYILLALAACTMVACQEEQVSNDPRLQLTFSHDTVLFDTVFTNMGTSTKRVMVYNPNKNALCIQQVYIRNGEHFHINLDGENKQEEMQNIILRGGDSLFLFIRAHINPLAENSPVLVEDDIVFSTNNNLQHIYLQAYGQNIEKIQGKDGLKI